MSILVTGATGFVGKNLIKSYSEKQDFRCVVRNGESDRFDDAYTVKSIDGKTKWDNCFNGVKSIIHLAGIAHEKTASDLDFQKVNIDGTLQLALKAAEAGVKRFVFVSSIGVNGTKTTDTPFLPDDKPMPHNCYAISKYKAEVGLKDIAQKTGLEVVIVRPTLVYGVGAPGNFERLTKLIKLLSVLPFGLATNRRNFIAVQNLVDFLVTCAEHPKASGHTFLASDNEAVSIKEFSNLIAEGMGKKIYHLPLPLSLMNFIGKLTGKSLLVEQLFGNLEVNSSNIKEVLNWTQPYSMKEAMETLCTKEKYKS
ncbi:UDP-glucose 4-epimerase [Vibrio cyclitrophicus]|uniref:NAD-dependent epimerase/dehydratase family protein n=1 Tax=Vibrio cyclitrophicus TaxID=47951 RepID=UPI0007EECCD9|nr:NAD-dependent epimerase/dehydratase family protein [Vibrio cyclitrophicus]OBS93554.1 UDP-glucose 4-epimerase [Vibrio cyclitrophicus]